MTSERQRQRAAARIAVRIAGRLIGEPADRTGAGHAEKDGLADLDQRCRRFGRRLALLRLAAARGWSKSTTELRSDLASLLGGLASAARLAQEPLLQPLPAAPTADAVLAELRHLAGEFDEVGLDLKAQTVWAVIGPIELEGVTLGRFRLVLHVTRLGPAADVSCLDVEALNPNPPTADDAVTHPHVRSGRLCAGEAAGPLQAALRQGRIADAFLLVRSVLETYAADSPYVALENWSGRDCPDCGRSVPEDDLTGCDACGHDLCTDCSSFCRRCEETRCAGCLEDCAACGEPTCRRCRAAAGPHRRFCCRDCRKDCRECGSSFAADELDGETGRCPDCREPEAEPESSSPLPSPSHTSRLEISDETPQEPQAAAPPLAAGGADGRSGAPGMSDAA